MKMMLPLFRHQGGPNLINLMGAALFVFSFLTTTITAQNSGLDTIRERANIKVSDNAKVGVIVTGSGNTINTTQIFVNSPEYTSIKNHREKLETAIVKKSDECEQMRRDSLPARYLEICRSDLIALNVECDSMKKVENRFREDVIRLAESFAQIPLNSERLRLAKQFFDEGKIQEADAVLKSADMENETDALLEENRKLVKKRVSNDSLRQLKSAEWLIKAQVCQTRCNLTFWQDSAKYYFRRSLECWQSLENMWGYSYFLSQQNNIDSTVYYLEKCFDLVENDIERASLCKSLGIYYSNIEKIAEAETMMRCALDIYRGLAMNDLPTFEPLVASTLKDLGNLYFEQNDLSNAQSMFLWTSDVKKFVNDARPGYIWNTLPGNFKLNSSVFKRLERSSALDNTDKTTVLANLGILLASKGDFTNAEISYLSAQRILRGLNKTNPRGYDSDIASLQFNLGNLYLNQGKLMSCESAYLSSLEIRIRLAEKNPLAYEPDLALNLISLGNLYLDLNKFDSAIYTFSSALEIQKRLVESNLLDREVDLARTYRLLGTAFNKIGRHEQVIDQNGLPEMVRVSGGTFTMGSPKNDIDRNDDESQHLVTISDFEIGKYPVTQKLWRNIMEGSHPPNIVSSSCDNCPVENVSWNDVQEFLKRINVRFPGKNYRLPTEAEWEYAARGGSKSQGFKYAGSNNLKEVGWFSENAKSKTHPVGQNKPNELGLYDMSGNVNEWCSDWYGDYASAARTNPTGAENGAFRVLRGGSWADDARRCRISSRLGSMPEYRNSDTGFRLASSPQ